MSTTLASKAPPESPAEPEGGGRSKLIGIVLLVVALGAAGWYFFLKPKPEAAPKPGEVVQLEPVQVNLEGGHYLRIGIALQMTTTVAHEPDGSKALDATIELFTGLDMNDLADAKERHKLKEELQETLVHEYHGDVMGVYFTEFVTQ